MTRLHGPAARLADGSVIIVRRLLARLVVWVRKGRRDDLDGWRAALGCVLRLIALLVGGWMLYRLVRALPALMWLLSGCWTLAAWRAGKPNEEAVEGGGGEGAPTLDREAVRTLLLGLMEGHSAVHLSTVLAHLQQHPPTAALTAPWTIADLRARLEALGIPVDPKVKARGRGPTRGVRRSDLAPSPEEAPEPSTAPSTAA